MYIKILFRQYSRGAVKLCEALRRKSLFNSILPNNIPFRFEILSSEYIYSGIVIIAILALILIL